MRPARTVVVGIISFALGIVVATRLPLSAAGQQPATQQPTEPPPVVVKPGPKGLTFQSQTKNYLLIMGIGEPQQPPTRFHVENGQVTLPTTKSAYMVYEVVRTYAWQPDKLGLACLPNCPPPPCPGCPPWPVSGMWGVRSPGQ